jgi:hypothetical protein
MPNAVPVNYNTPFGAVTICDPITEREAGGSLVGPFPPPRPTKAQIIAALGITFVVSEAIREAREIPSGTLYAMLVGKVDYEGYQKMLGILKRAGLIEVMPSHLIRWTGPEVTR